MRRKGPRRLPGRGRAQSVVDSYAGPLDAGHDLRDRTSGHEEPGAVGTARDVAHERGHRRRRRVRRRRRREHDGERRGRAQPVAVRVDRAQLIHGGGEPLQFLRETLLGRERRGGGGTGRPPGAAASQQHKALRPGRREGDERNDVDPTHGLLFTRCRVRGLSFVLRSWNIGCKNASESILLMPLTHC